MTDITPHSHAEDIIIFGDCWPVVRAVENVIKKVVPECVCKTVSDLSSLIYQLAVEPQAVLILCLRPREHIFLFYALREELVNHPTLVISDEIFFSDKLILHTWGHIPSMMDRELELMITSMQLCELYPPLIRYCPEESTLTAFLMSPVLPSAPPEIPQVFHVEERLMDYMSLLMYRALLECGLSPFRIRLLQAIWSGHQTLNELAAVMGESTGKIWNEKHRLLTQLGIPVRLREILYGTQFCRQIQRSNFITPAEVEKLHNSTKCCC
ncbi:hypothetical protein CI374_14395 [Salmonella enterica subsp. enterica serovar Panama]|nr:hypothetical protein [Salmonella enterica subsp. enterica serovar Panama]